MKKINKIFRIILILFPIYFLVKYINKEDILKILECLCVPILVLLPKFIENKINDKLIFIYYFYIFILLILGSIAEFYTIFKYYDVFAHFMFGFLGSITGLYTLNIFNINKNILFNIIFIISITLALASLWEIFEYIGSILFNIDPQNTLKTGVRDTMEDIIASLISSIIFVIVYKFNRNKLNNLVK